MSDALLSAWRQCLTTVETAAAGREVTLVAVSKTQPASAIRTLAGAGQHHFGENYLQEAQPKIIGCADLKTSWHFIGPLQSNKCREVALHFDWVQSVDRPKLIAALAQHRPPGVAPLNVLIQVNIDGEASKSGCRPADVATLAEAIMDKSALRLRGLMAIPQPHPDTEKRRGGFDAMRALFDAVRSDHPGIDTLSIGMSDDYVEAIAAGATMVRIGSALFGPRTRGT